VTALRPLVKLDRVSKTLGGRSILRDIDLEVKEAEILVVMGPSGSGKTTLLKIMAGDLTPDHGRIIHWRPDYTAHIGFILQRLNVFPWLTVQENIAFGLRQRNGSSREKTRKMLETLELDEFADYYPAELSGGMLQRVAIGRTLVRDPRLILMDEPFTGLDYARRKELHGMVWRLQEEMQTTVVLVTHDIEDAIRLGNRIVVLSESPGSIKEWHNDVHLMDADRKLALVHEFLGD
jgi:ABC-type nitrate/sulfonate/bicarbonate transport system ATPase subunit